MIAMLGWFNTYTDDVSTTPITVIQNWQPTAQK